MAAWLCLLASACGGAAWEEGELPAAHGLPMAAAALLWERPNVLPKARPGRMGAEE